MKSIYIFFILIIILSSCSSSNITYDYDHNAIFSNYKTYSWLNHSEFNPSDMLLKNENLEIKIKRAVNKILKNKNLTFQENGKPDFVIFIHTGKQSKDGLYKFYPWWQPCGYTSVSTFEENSLVIDIIGKNNSLIWRGLAPGFFKSYKKTQYLQKELDNVVTSILDGFPPN